MKKLYAILIAIFFIGTINTNAQTDTPAETVNTIEATTEVKTCAKTGKICSTTCKKKKNGTCCEGKKSDSSCSKSKKGSFNFNKSNNYAKTKSSCSKSKAKKCCKKKTAKANTINEEVATEEVSTEE